MFTAIMEWLDVGYRKPVFLTVATIILFALVYFLCRRRLESTAASKSVNKFKKRITRLSFLLVLVICLTGIWRAHIKIAADIHNWFAGNRVYGNLVWSVLVAIFIYFLYRMLLHSLLRNVTEIQARHKLRRGVFWSMVGLFLVCGALIWAHKIQNLGVFLGIIGAGVALSLQETLLCLAGWALIIINKPFDIGDRIEIDGRKGDVIDIRLFQTFLLEVGNWVHGEQSTGRMISVPNSMIYRGVCFNYTKGFPFLWNEIRTAVTFESDWQRAKEIILAQAAIEASKIEEQVGRQIQKMQQQYAIYYHHLTPIVYTEIIENGVALTLRYLVPVRSRRSSTDKTSESILKALMAEPNIDFAYPTMRIFRNSESPRPVSQNV